jgi:hypothetical protein
LAEEGKSKHAQSDLLRYFGHEFAFSLLLLALGLMWAMLLVFLVVIGLFLGLIIGIILLLLILGGLNSFLALTVWSINVKSDWKNLLIHGLVLFILLIIVHIPSLIITYGVPGLMTTIALFIFNAFIDCYVAKHVALWWEEKPTPTF